MNIETQKTPNPEFVKAMTDAFDTYMKLGCMTVVPDDARRFMEIAFLTGAVSAGLNLPNLVNSTQKEGNLISVHNVADLLVQQSMLLSSEFGKRYDDRKDRN